MEVYRQYDKTVLGVSVRGGAVVVDVGAFATNWNPSAIYYRLEADSSGVQSSQIAFADVVPVEADALRLVVTETWGQSYDKPKPRAHVFAFDAL